MSRPRIATVLTARPWESDFVMAARATSSVRIVARAYEAAQVPDDADVVIVGSEVAWVTPVLIGRWVDAGRRVIGIHPAGDAPGRQLLRAGRAHEVRPDDTGSVELVGLARLLAHQPARPATAGTVIVVTGPEGAPGRTEVSILTALTMADRQSSVLVDLDPNPSVSLRLGLAPRPDTSDLAESLHAGGAISDLIRRVGSLDVVAGSFGRGPLERTAARDIVWGLARSYDRVILDTGPWTPADDLVPLADRAIIVCDASPVGVVRTAGMTMEWMGPEPALVLNRVVPGPFDAVAEARRAVGLDPTIVLGFDPSIRLGSLTCRPPDVDRKRSFAGLAA